MTADILKSHIKKGINWYRVCLMILVMMSPVSIYALKGWMKENYVSTERDINAWKQQIEINERITKQIMEILKTLTENQACDTGRDIRMRMLEEELKEQRRELMDKLRR